MPTAPLTIENNASLLLFLRMWNGSGPLAINMANDLRIASEVNGIELPNLHGRDLRNELQTFHSHLGAIIDKIKSEK